MRTLVLGTLMLIPATAAGFNIIALILWPNPVSGLALVICLLCHYIVVAKVTR